MADKTVRFFQADLTGETGLTAELINPSTGAVGNGAGDSVTEVGNGVFTFVVTEAITGWWKVVIKKVSVIYASGGNVNLRQDIETTYDVDDPSITFDAISDVTEDIDNETIAQLVFQSIVGSGLAKYSIPQVTGTVEAVKYADFELSISTSTASDSVLYLSIGCENHTTPNLQADSTDGLTILNQLEDFDPADVTIERTSPTVVDVWISARVLPRLTAADYLIALTEITSDAKTKLRFEKHFSLRSGAGRIIG